jgi:hypothetical protein
MRNKIVLALILAAASLSMYVAVFFEVSRM